MPTSGLNKVPTQYAQIEGMMKKKSNGITLRTKKETVLNHKMKTDSVPELAKRVFLFIRNEGQISTGTYTFVYL